MADTKTAVIEEPKGIAALVLSPKVQDQLRMALPRGGVTPERMARMLLTECRRNPDLLKCSTASLLGALMQCAQVGLEPGPMGLAYIIPYGGEAQFQLGYRGLIQLMWRSEQISSIGSEVVYEKDHFVFANGAPPKLEHRPASGDRGKPTHVWAAIGTKSGGWIPRVMTFDEIEAHRAKYSKAKSGPWFTAWDEMACKTVLKRTAKRAPVSSEALAAIALDDAAEALHIDADFTVEEPAASPAQAMKDQVAAKAAETRKATQ